jgi:hypothetical protein
VKGGIRENGASEARVVRGEVVENGWGVVGLDYSERDVRGDSVHNVHF